MNFMHCGNSSTHFEFVPSTARCGKSDGYLMSPFSNARWDLDDQQKLAKHRAGQVVEWNPKPKREPELRKEFVKKMEEPGMKRMEDKPMKRQEEKPCTTWRSSPDVTLFIPGQTGYIPLGPVDPTPSVIYPPRDRSVYAPLS